MAAIMVSKEFNVPNNVIVKTISEFKGVEHRLEYVDTINGCKYYNDTEATNIKCTQIALSSFNKPTIIFLGGLERGQDFNELTPYMKNVKAVIAIGQFIYQNLITISKFVKIYNSENIKIQVIRTYIRSRDSYEFLRDGFEKAYTLSSSGDVVLLSPASASWDQYKECEVRGSEFKQLVHNLRNDD